MLLNRRHGLTHSRIDVILLWATLIGLDTTAQLLFKLAAQSLGHPEVSLRWLHMIAQSAVFWAAAMCLVLTFPIWMLILRRSQLNLAFPATALTYLGVIGGSQLVFGESIDTVQYAGIVLIVIGVALLRRPIR